MNDVPPAVPSAVPSARELFDLTGTTAFVTGGTTGIGLATARVLASAGADTVISGLAADDPTGVAAGLAAGLDGSVAGVPCDVTDDDQLRAAVQFTLTTFGRIDTLFCNAGIALDTGPLIDERDDQLDPMFDVHVRSVWHLCNMALPHMASGGGGSVVIMSSLSGLRGNRAIGLYGITKAANAQLARNLAVQWADRNIRVNALSPGVIATELSKPITADPRIAAGRLAKTPLGVFGETYHVAGAVLWLASKAGSFVTGQNIVIDGGTLISD